MKDNLGIKSKKIRTKKEQLVKQINISLNN